MTIAELRSRQGDAFARMERANAAFSDPQGRSADVLDAEYRSAKEEHARASAAVLRQQEVDEGRAAIPGGVRAIADGSMEVRDGASLRVSGEPLTYQQRDGNHILRDMLAQRQGDPDAIERLNRHRQETAQEMERVLNERDRYGAVQDRATITQTAGETGELIAPAYLQNKWIGLPRPTRPIANSLNAQPWIQTNSINLPKVKTGTTVETQTDTGSVAASSMKTELVTGVAQTVAGQQDASQSLVDLSAPGVGDVIFDDLTRNYDQQLDTKVIENAVTNAKGINGISGVNSVAFTTGSPKFSEFYKKIARAIGEVNTGIFAPPTVIAMTPLRWAWILSQLDTAERPLVVPVGQPGFNAGALQERVAAENIVGTLQGIPVISDASIPQTKGAATNQDEVYVYRAENLYLWESTPTLRVFEEVLSGKLEVRFQLYGYFTPMFGRLPKSISIVSGTGLTAPTF